MNIHEIYHFLIKISIRLIIILNIRILRYEECSQNKVIDMVFPITRYPYFFMIILPRYLFSRTQYSLPFTVDTIHFN